MPIQNIPIPSYLEPPDQATQEQINLKRDAMQQEQSDKIAQKIRSRVAMEKLVGDTRVAQAGGMDPEKAQHTALYVNAYNLFPDDPNQAIKLRETILQKDKFEQAKRAYQQDLGADIKSGMTPEDAFSKNIAKYAVDLFPGSTAGRALPSVYNTEMRAKTAAQTESGRNDRFQKMETRKTNADLLKFDLGNRNLDLRTQQGDERLGIEQQKADAATKQADTAATKASKPSAAEMKQRTDLDNEIRGTQRLITQLGPRPKFVGTSAWDRTSKSLQTELDELKKQRAQLGKGQGDSGPTDQGAVDATYDPQARKLVR